MHAEVGSVHAGVQDILYRPFLVAVLVDWAKYRMYEQFQVGIENSVATPSCRSTSQDHIPPGRKKSTQKWQIQNSCD